MAGLVVIPLVAALGIADLGSRLGPTLRPAGAARGTAAMLGAVLVAALTTFWLIGLSGLVHVGLENPLSDWSRHLLPDHAPGGALLGATMFLLATVGTARALRVLVVHRRIRCRRTPPLQFVESEQIFAHTLPGPARTVAVSTGLRRMLDASELEIVVAHERAHARHRHDRLLLLGLLTKAVVPVTSRVVGRLEFQIERWADEEAVRSTGADRRAVARTLARVALHASHRSGALGVARHGVAARAEALVHPPRTTFWSRLTARMAVSATLGLMAWQLGQLAVFLDGLQH